MVVIFGCYWLDIIRYLDGIRSFILGGCSGLFIYFEKGTLIISFYYAVIVEVDGIFPLSVFFIMGLPWSQCFSLLEAFRFQVLVEKVFPFFLCIWWRFRLLWPVECGFGVIITFSVIVDVVCAIKSAFEHCSSVAIADFCNALYL
jgi:hypothetical protein